MIRNNDVHNYTTLAILHIHNDNKNIRKYQVNIQSKPYPYLPDDEIVNIESTFGIHSTPRDKRAPKRNCR